MMTSHSRADWRAYMIDPYNRQCFERFCQIALQAKAAGMRRWSARGIFHVMRWEEATRDGDDTFKINSKYSPMLAREAMCRYPKLGGFFVLRDR